MREARIIFVTGKGGVGKTTVAAALGSYAVDNGLRTLIIETAGDGSLAQLFEHRALGTTPRRLQPQLDAVGVDARQLVEEYFSRLLRFQWLSNRLLSSTTFNALTAAAPGITEFLLLERILGWVEPGIGMRRRHYDLVIVDGPATGHVVKLLRTPRNLATLVPGGPLGKTARRLLSLLGDRQRTQVVLVGLPEEMVVRETIETHEILAGDLTMHVARPVVNRVFPRHFTASEAAQIAAEDEGDPVIAAARFNIAARREAERQVAQLRRRLGVTPVLLRQIFSPEVHAGDLRSMGRTLGRAVLAADAAASTGDTFGGGHS
jgi:anion-transporting  ArsA/GET3 family ATPase